MKKVLIAMILAGGMATSASVIARDVTVTVTNLTNGNYFTPLFYLAHDRAGNIFRVSTTASTGIQAMAEGGDISELVGDAELTSGKFIANPAEGLLAPGASASGTFDLRRKNKDTAYLSVVAMVLPTNDAFLGMDSLEIPKKPGIYTYFLSSYDAGTEANDEIVNGGGPPGIPGIPADPGGNNGVGGTGAAGDDINQLVHIHPGVLGDMDPDGGFSDLDATIHRWNDPVAKVVVTVGRGK